MRSLAALCIFVGAMSSVANAEESAGPEWSQMETLNDKKKEKVPIGTNEVDFYVGRKKELHDPA
jgi:hypothetical protein